MSLFDPDEFAVCGETLFRRIALPGLPLSIFGMVREVYVQGEDLEPIRCVCFTMGETAAALKMPVSRIKESTYLLRTPAPKYAADRINIMRQGGATRRRVNVFLYPEVAVLQSFPDAIQYARNTVRSEHKSMQAEIKRQFQAIRQTVEETIP